MDVTNNRKTLSKVFFVIALAMIIAIASLYLYNIIKWGNLPDYGYGFRTATGVKVVGVVLEVGRKAGLSVGDHIIKVNGRTVSNYEDMHAVRNRQIGDKNIYLIEREGKQFEIAITNSPLGLKESFMRYGFPFPVGLCYVLIGTLVFLMKPHRGASWAFFAFCSILGIFFMFLYKGGLMNPFELENLNIFAYVFAPAVFIHLALVFPIERHIFKEHPYAQFLPYLVSALLFLCIRLLVPTMMDAPKPLSIIFIAYFLVSVLIFLGSCFQLLHTSPSEITKLRSKMILLGVAISASIPIFDTLFNTLFHIYIVPSFNYYLPFFIVFPLFVGYSIVKHNLFDIDAIIKRTYGYVLTTGSIAGIYGLIILTSNVAFRRFEITKSPLFPLLFVLAVVFLFNPIRNRIQKFIDRVFYRLEYDYQETVQRISESLKSLLSLDQIGKRMMETASRTMFIDSGCILISKPEDKRYEPLICLEKRDEFGRTISSRLPTAILPANDPLIQKMAERKREVTIYDIQEDPLFEHDRETCKKAFNQLEAALVVPVVYEDSLAGLISLGNKKSGKFYRRQDINLLRILANQGAVAIENARLHQARIEALEQSKKDLEQLNRAKSRALDHLSHELRTPLSVIQGNIRILKRKTQTQTPPIVKEEFFESLEKNLGRLSDIQQETDQIIRSYQKLETKQRFVESDDSQPSCPERIDLYPFTERILENVKKQAIGREIQFQLEGDEGLHMTTDPKILEDVLVGLLKNAIENTPDEGIIRVVLEQKAQWLQVKVQDFGVGITNENRRHLFEGLFHTLDTELYSSKRPYDFGAGGKGLDLLRMKTYGRRFGFDIMVGSQRCIYIPTDRDLCPGRISTCPHCKKPEDCLSSGGSTFCLTFVVTEGEKA